MLRVKPGKPDVLLNHLLLTCLTRLWTGVHMRVICLPMGCHVLSGSHLITWGLDTALISDLRCGAVERWSSGALAGALAHGAPGKLVEEILDLSLGRPRPGQALLPGKGGLPKVMPCRFV